jgi:tRNA dimethylallyltransferase
MVRSPLTPVVLAGPTASGKSALALALCERLGGEVVCADSRQVYEGMVLGAAAPSPEERAKVAHHGYNAIPPEEPYDAGRFLTDTDRFAAEVRARGKVPVLVGGSGLYLRVWRYGLEDVPPRDDVVRARLEAELEERGAAALHARLAASDPEAAARIKPTDPIRIVRGLEILEVTGQRPSALRKRHGAAAPRVEATWLLLEAAQEWLAPRVEERARHMMVAGLVDEAVRLRERLGEGHRLLRTMGYEEALLVADNTLSPREATALMAGRQRQYARRQRTWFKKEPWWRAFEASAPGLLPSLEAALVAPP